MGGAANWGKARSSGKAGTGGAASWGKAREKDAVQYNEYVKAKAEEERVKRQKEEIRKRLETEGLYNTIIQGKHNYKRADQIPKPMTGDDIFSKKTRENVTHPIIQATNQPFVPKAPVEDNYFTQKANQSLTNILGAPQPKPTTPFVAKQPGKVLPPIYGPVKPPDNMALISQIKPEEISLLAEARVKGDNEYIKSYQKELVQRAKGSPVKTAKQLGKGLMEGLVSVPEKVGDSVQAITGWNDLEDRSKKIDEQQIERTNKYRTLLETGQIDEEQYGLLQSASRQQADAQRQDAAQDTEWAGTNGNNLRIAAGVALEGGADVAGLFMTGGAYNAAKGAKALMVAKNALGAGVSGAGIGLGESMQGQEWTAQEALTKAGTGLGMGIAVGVVAGTAGAVAGKLGKDAINKVNQVKFKNRILEVDDAINKGKKTTVSGAQQAQEAAKTRRLAEKANEATSLTLREKIFQKTTNKYHKLLKEARNVMNDEQYEKLEYALGTVPRSNLIAQDWMKKNGFNKVVQTLNDVKTKEVFEEYLLAKQRQFRRVTTKVTPEFMKGASQDARTINELSGQFEELAQEFYGMKNSYLRTLSKGDDLVFEDGRGGILSNEYIEKLIAENPEHVSLQKILENVDDKIGLTGGNIGSLSKQTTVKGKFKGVAGIEKSPLETTMDMIHLGERQRAVNTLGTLMKETIADGNPFGIKVLRSLENVSKRIEIRSYLKDTKRTKSALVRNAQKNTRAMRALKVALHYQERNLKKAVKSKGKQKAFADYALKEFNNVERFPTKKGKKLARQPDIEDIGKLYDQWITSPKSGLKQQLHTLAKTNKAFKDLEDDLIKTRNSIEAINKRRHSAWLEQKKLSDESRKRKNTISIQNNGVTEVLEVPDWMEASLKNVDNTQSHQVIRAMILLNRVRKTFFTGVNAPFTARNVPRDIQTATVTGRSGWGNLNPKNVVKGLFDVLADNQAHSRALQKGGLGTLVDTMRPSHQSINNVIRSGKPGVAKLWKNPKDAFVALEDVFNIGELAGRQRTFNIVYNRAKKQKLPEAEALRKATLAARNDSIDFFTKGEWGDLVQAWGLYLNPSIQGTRRFGVALKTHPVQTVTRYAAVIAGPAIATTMWNMGDPKRVEIYNEIPEYEKESNFIIIGPNSKWDEKNSKWTNVYKIPKVPGLSAIGNAFQDITELAMKEGYDLQLRDVLASLGMGGLKTFEFENNLKNAVTPDPIEPVAEQVFNQKFFTGDEIEPADREYREKKEDYSSNIAKKVQDVTGISPLRTDHFIKSITGGVGEAGLNLVDRRTGAEDPSGRSLLEQIKGSFEGSFGGETDKQFWSTYEDIKSDKDYGSSKITEVAKTGDYQKAQKMAQELNKEIDQRFKPWFDKFYGTQRYSDRDYEDYVKKLKVSEEMYAIKGRGKQ